MNLELRRHPSSANSTIGLLYIENVFECFTLEDIVREVPGEPIESWKVPGKTAIPAGRYRITITPSMRFKRDLPLLNDVPGFKGVRIHTGNTSEDTEGCILVGDQMAADAVVQSRVAFAELFDKLKAALNNWEEVWMAVKPAGEQTA